MYYHCMEIQYERTITVGQYIAELLEVEASRLPPSQHANAEILREQAKTNRESLNPNLVRIWRQLG
jgi:hypothetical protein